MTRTRKLPPLATTPPLCFLVDGEGTELGRAPFDLAITFKVHRAGRATYVVDASDEVLFDLGGQVIVMVPGDVFNLKLSPS